MREVCVFHSARTAIYLDTIYRHPLCTPCASLVRDEEPSVGFTVIETGTVVSFPTAADEVNPR